MNSENPKLLKLYHLMYKSRLFEEAVAHLWNEGLISGEMHMGLGEEAICAGTVSWLQDGDAMALDHRGTPPLVMRGADLQAMLLEMLGHEEGLCAGMGGHMHLLDKNLLSASSGIVGASGPAAAGFALAAKYLRPGKIAVAFFGEGAVNQGMLMESFNLAVIWKLPVLFVCKDNDWSITTRSSDVTGGDICERAESFGMAAYRLNGFNVDEVAGKTGDIIGEMRRKQRPAFVHATCIHLEGHFLGDPLLRFKRTPGKQLKEMGLPMVRSAVKLKGTSIRERIKSIKKVTNTITRSTKDHFITKQDPLLIAREKLSGYGDMLAESENGVKSELNEAVTAVLQKLEKS